MQTTAANPLSRRLNAPPLRLKAWYLRWLQASLVRQLADLQLSIDQATDLAIAMAQANRYSPSLQGQRRDMRVRRELLTERLQIVTAELAELQQLAAAS
ncbi:hypothetical protein [Roseateles asaccharophilus]|uniref:Uncharacterized protein n=1 Tax=Roseateles asaccharophilus TaxID=582607 RepID=A0ABU2A3H1_9BURK|nr:hypothetical protein [Roseateles asaccharophilus]MDR7331740.1 hypothetical protein [Roseateles asaccharophilus]